MCMYDYLVKVGRRNGKEIHVNSLKESAIYLER